MMMTRRRMIAISAAFAASPVAARAHAGATRLWAGQALGARVSIRLDHPEAKAIAARVMAEIDRLEDVFSLYRPQSALCRLNREGKLKEPPFELLDCLSLADAVHRASDGRFDPTVQPLWALWAQAAAAGGRPDAHAIEEARRRTGWDKVAFDAAAITVRPGMALTLNGIGQGYVADRVASLLEAENLTDILIDTGELRAIGGNPRGGGPSTEGWPVRLETGGRIALWQRALSTSAPLGTTFDRTGKDGHILDPLTGMPAPEVWRAVSVSAATAAIADALATTACLLPDLASIVALVEKFEDARVEGIA